MTTIRRRTCCAPGCGRRLYLCTGARRDRGDLAEFLDAVLGAGVDIVQLREKGLEAKEELGLLEVFADACRAMAACSRSTTGRTWPWRPARRAPPGPGRPARPGRAAHPRPGPADRAQATARPRRTRRPPNRERTTSAPGRCGPRRRSRAARRPAWTCSPTWRARRRTGPGSRSAASTSPGSTTSWPRRHPGGRGPRHHRGRRPGRRRPCLREPTARRGAVTGAWRAEPWPSWPGGPARSSATML